MAISKKQYKEIAKILSNLDEDLTWQMNLWKLHADSASHDFYNCFKLAIVEFCHYFKTQNSDFDVANFMKTVYKK